VIKFSRSSDQFFCQRYESNYGKIPYLAMLKDSSNTMLSYRREIALQGALVLAKSKRLELRDNILRTYVYLQQL